MKFTTLIIIFVSLFIYNDLNAQVGGVSASKLATITTGTVAPNTIEFEPSFSASFYRYGWDENGNKVAVSPNADSLFVESGLSYRFTYGVIQNLEIGMSLPNDVSSLSIGSKYLLGENGPLSYGLLLGLNFPLGNSAYNTSGKSLGYVQYYTAVAGGLVLTYHINDVFSLDMDLQYQRHFQSVNENDFHNSDYFVDVDAGYYLEEWFQVILGMNYYNLGYGRNGVSESKWSINPGITIETAKNFLMVLNFPYDVYGKNTPQTFSFSFALTMTIE